MFKSKEKKYLEMFYAEAYEAQEELNQLFTFLEKNPDDQESIEAIFRITHTIKGNSMAIGLDGIGELSHSLEDIFTYVNDNKVKLGKDFFTLLFRCSDKLGEMIESIKSGNPVSYQGLLAKLDLYKEKHFQEADQVAHPSETNPEELDKEITTKDEVMEQNVSVEVGSTSISFSDQVQIPVQKLDGLLNLVGELIIEKDTIIAKNQTRSNSNEFKRLHRITSDMQYAIMDARLVQVGSLFNKFHRIARDVSEIESKEVNLELIGTEIEIDRNILKTMSDSLVHLVRNAISHGIESSDERIKNGKPEEGTVTLKARNEKDTVLIEVSDDGAGIDPLVIKEKAIEKGIVSQEYADTLSDKELMYLVFESGFSNAETINEISGRGVGMDVVRRSTESIGGQVVLDSKVGVGSTFTLKLPSSMAVKGALLFEQDHQEYAVPLSYTESVVSISQMEIHKIGRGLMANYQDKTMPLVFLRDAFDAGAMELIHENGGLQRSFDSIKGKGEEVKVIVVNYNEKYLGIVVDKLLQQKEIVEKPLSKPLDTVELFSGATILGNGNVCLVLNVATIIDHTFSEKRTMKVNYSEAV